MSASEETLRRLRSVRGHLDAVICIVEHDRYCIEVLHEIGAVQGALDRSRRALLDNRLRTCVADAYARGDHDQTVTSCSTPCSGAASPAPARTALTRGRRIAELAATPRAAKPRR